MEQEEMRKLRGVVFMIIRTENRALRNAAGECAPGRQIIVTFGTEAAR